MKIFVLLLSLLTASEIMAQSSWSVPKYSPSYKRTSRDVGPLPGSKAPANAQATTFKRIQSRPAGMRLLVRTNCNSRPGRGELISRARKLTTSDGPVVQIDWEPINGREVVYWAVASAHRKITEVNVDVEDGKYKARGNKTSSQDHWEVKQLKLGKARCVKDKELTSRDVRLAVANFLNQFSVNFFRRPSDQFSSN